jgi:hypothetical protein
MLTSVIGYYFTHLNVTYFSSFWFLGGSDTGLAVLLIALIDLLYIVLLYLVINGTPQYVVPPYLVPT